MIEHLSLADVHDLAQDCLTRAGTRPDIAHAVAAEIAAAEAAGERPHGMAALLRDLRLIRYGRLDPTATCQDSHPRPGVMHRDAGHGFAPAALSGAVDPLAAMARQQGLAMLRLRRSSDPGALIGIVAQMAARGLAALAVSGTGAARIAHPDMARPMLLHRAAPGMMALFLPTTDCDTTDDSPLGARVAHEAWILALDPATAGDGLIDAALRQASAAPEPAGNIALPTELLERIVTA